MPYAFNPVKAAQGIECFVGFCRQYELIPRFFMDCDTLYLFTGSSGVFLDRWTKEDYEAKPSHLIYQMELASDWEWNDANRTWCLRGEPFND